MKSTFVLPTVVLGAVLGAGCAAVDNKAPGEAKAPREFRTGSHIPLKEPMPPPTDAERERTAEQVREMQRISSQPKARN